MKTHIFPGCLLGEEFGNMVIFIWEEFSLLNITFETLQGLREVVVGGNCLGGGERHKL